MPDSRRMSQVNKRVLKSAAKTAAVTAAATLVTKFLDSLTGNMSDPTKAALIVAIAGVLKGAVKQWEIKLTQQ